MSEVLFRGKRKDNGQWMESGSFCRSSDDGIIWDCFLGTGKPAIHNLDSRGNICASATLDTCMFCVVDPETVGQYTGLTDKNGKKIFEGDIIEWNELEWGAKHRELVEWDYLLFSMRKDDWSEWCEVIGNIHDNPELLEVE